MVLHTVLGAGGAISNELVPLLLKNNIQVRLVSRNPQPSDNSIAADITDYQQTLNAVKGSDIVYLLVGLVYDIKVWEKQWPKIMTNVINACKETGAKLIFFDNVYMYGKVAGTMTEETPVNPCSKKGELRAAIATQLMNEVAKGTIKALIARSADFYGPYGDKTSVPNMLIFANLAKKKTPQWLVNADLPHSFTFIPDAAKALYLLANDDTAWGKVWHLPTAAPALTGREFIKLASAAMNRPYGCFVLPKFMLLLAGLFDKTIKESYEMLYQSDAPYIFSSAKFEKHFNDTPTPYEEGIKITASGYRK